MYEFAHRPDLPGLIDGHAVVGDVGTYRLIGGQRFQRTGGTKVIRMAVPDGESPARCGVRPKRGERVFTPSHIGSCDDI